jgi:colanic acid biosynthesis glycosyl transferase WcaI
MRILLLSQFCTPEPIFKSVPFAAELRRRGHEVRILTGFPNYPGGKVYSGYRMRLWQREELDGVPILRVPLFPSHGRSIVGRLLNYVSFAAVSLLPLLLGWKPDVVYVYNLVTLGVSARLNRLLRGVPYIMDVQDLWPDSVLQSGMGLFWMSAPLKWLCQQAYQGAIRVVTLSPGMANEQIRRGVHPDKTQCIYNWCDERAIASPDGIQTVPGFEGRFNILYAGNLGTAQGLEAVVDAAALVAKSNPRIQFVFMGQGVCSDRLRKQAQEIAPNNTLFLDARPQSEAAGIMKQADVLLLHLAPKPLFEITIPSKCQTYLALGVPVLAAVGGDAAELIDRSGGGWGCKPGHPSELAKIALKFSSMDEETLQAMGEAGRSFYRNELSFYSAVTQWLDCFQSVVGKSE